MASEGDPSLTRVITGQGRRGSHGLEARTAPLHSRRLPHQQNEWSMNTHSQQQTWHTITALKTFI
ncbi:Hypothetical predicted protein [Pelobates cultripes]|uniref:Uncharacterized protein n=1 Tax=Pelobates cultripes TaxID=61616 RepID=A0AAD1W1Z4_PELCU|nr:Hypothetical predicted protein [Pelobates cultripes]